MANGFQQMQPGQQQGPMGWMQAPDGSWHWGPAPPMNYNQGGGYRGGSLGGAGNLVSQGHMGFGNQLQGAMSQMAGMNLANQSASMNLRELANQRQRDFWSARVGMMNANAGMMAAMAPVYQEQFRAQALAQALGMGNGGQRQRYPNRYTSNIGQGINMYPNLRS